MYIKSRNIATKLKIEHRCWEDKVSCLKTYSQLTDLPHRPDADVDGQLAALLPAS